MTEYAPQAIKDLFNTIKAGIPSAQMAGIIGDSAHTYGYHRGRNYVSSSDYSVCQNPADRKGDGEAACALDISWSKAGDQYTVSKRLLDAKNNATMKKYVRSFFGSTDGVNVCGWDYYQGCSSTSDDSHLWHVHLSITRQYANDHDALQAVAQVVIGGSSGGGGGGGGASTPEGIMGMSKYTTSQTSEPQTLGGPGQWTSLHINDDGDISILSSKAATKFMSNLHIGFTNLPAGAAAHLRYYLADVDANGKAKVATSYPAVEIAATSGGTSGEFSQFCTFGAPPSGHSYRLRAEGYCDVPGVQVNYVGVNTFYE